MGARGLPGPRVSYILMENLYLMKWFLKVNIAYNYYFANIKRKGSYSFILYSIFTRLNVGWRAQFLVLIISGIVYRSQNSAIKIPLKLEEFYYY